MKSHIKMHEHDMDECDGVKLMVKEMQSQECLKEVWVMDSVKVVKFCNKELRIKMVNVGVGSIN